MHSIVPFVDLAGNKKAAEYTSEELSSAFATRILPLLTKTTLLPTLATLQRTLDALDIEGLAKLWSMNPSNSVQQPSNANANNSSVTTTTTPLRHHQENIPVGWRSPEPTIDEWVAFTEEYLQSDAGRLYERMDLNGIDTEMGTVKRGGGKAIGRERGRLRFWMLAYLMSSSSRLSCPSRRPPRSRYQSRLAILRSCSTLRWTSKLYIFSLTSSRRVLVSFMLACGLLL